MRLDLFRKYAKDHWPLNPRSDFLESRRHARQAEAVRWASKSCAEWSEQDPASRLLIAGPQGAVQDHALPIARGLAAQDPRTLLIDTSQGAPSISALLELPRAPGLAELCQGRADFDAVIRRGREGAGHFLASGRPRPVGGAWGEPGAADRVFRALDESYRWIVFCAELDEALLLADNARRNFTAAILIDAQGLPKQPFLGDIFYRHGFPVFRLRG